MTSPAVCRGGGGWRVPFQDRLPESDRPRFEDGGKLSTESSAVGRRDSESRSLELLKLVTRHLVKQRLPVRRALRRAAGAGASVPILISSDGRDPRRSGEGYHWATRSGRRISHPGAYARRGFSNMVYCRSTRCVEAGALWAAYYVLRAAGESR